jgi:mRNA interferase MazF
MILCMITSNPYADNDAVLLETKDFESGNLPISPSYIRPSRLFTAEDALTLITKGRLTAPKMTEVVSKVVEIVQR